ncbi:MAG TPA: FAD-dependent oxidoreductase [Syntrophorhabdaceae bacterium]|nr:FAD-dependent oxidoreductase [Syntrophorhabdaceae bacterium]
MKDRYPHIFSEGRIGNLITKNRIKYAATETNFPYGDGYVSDREIAYMEAQAKGGAGIVTTQGAYPDRLGEGKGFKGMMAIYDDRFIPGLARIAEVIRKNNALSCIQILHCGREGGVDLDYCLMPSNVPQRLSYFKKPREITKDEIKKTIKDHMQAARRAVEAGFDMIELSGIVGYLISTFISKYTNKRTDEYGGSIKERCRLMVEIIQAVKAQVGDKVPVGIRLCGLELLDDRGGNTFEESLESFIIAEEAGADYLSVTIGWHESSIPVITRDVPMGYWLYVAKEVKRVVNVPVMMAFRQFLPHIPEKAISEGIIDFWEACRPMIADPEIPNKIASGREDEIVPCIACNLCFSRLYYHQPIMCSVRPSLGHEGEPQWGYYGFKKVDKPKKIIVIGGGPSGLQCASIAAKRGHIVKLFEKKPELGGAINLASKVDSGEEELLRTIRYLEGECRRAGVDIRTGVEISPDMIKDEAIDALVVATGAVAKKLDEIPDSIVFTYDDIIGKGKTPLKKSVIIGGSGIGLATAVFLLRQNELELTIIEERSRLGKDVNPFYLWRFIQILKKNKVNIFTNSEIINIKEDTLVIKSLKGEHTIPFEGLILAEREGNAGDFIPLKNFIKEIYFIGDAKKPRRLNNAIHDGYRLGMVI